LIGSSPRSDIYIFKDSKVMPTHAKIQKKGNKYEIIDNSKGVGVYVNSKKINESKILEDNDEIILGQSILEFQQKERI
jgi:pSer/pThr/pTyr-binding forkhead associated (FHA) protein